MAEQAVARVQRQAGALGQQVSALRRDVDGLMQQLGAVDPQLAAAARSVTRFRERMAQGTATPEEEHGYRGMLAQIGERGGKAGKAFLAALAEKPLDPFRPRSLTELERESYKQRGYSDDQLGRARMVAPHTIMVPPPPPRPREAPQIEVPGGIPGRLPADVRAMMARRRAGAKGGEGDEESKGVEQQTAAHHELTEEKRRGLFGEQALRREWTETTRQVRSMQSELAMLERTYDRLRQYDRKGFLSRRERVQLESLPGRMTDLKSGIAAGEGELATLGKRWGRMGGAVQGGGLVGGPRALLSMFLGSAGMAGGGGVGGLVGGAALGQYATGPLLAVAAAGMAIGYAWSFAKRGAEDYIATQQRIYETGMRLGGGFDELRRESAGRLRGPLLMTFDETLGAKMALASQTGRTDIGSISAMARAYGMPVPETAERIGRMEALGVAPTGRYRLPQGPGLAEAMATAGMNTRPRRDPLAHLGGDQPAIELFRQPPDEAGRAAGKRVAGWWDWLRDTVSGASLGREPAPAGSAGAPGTSAPAVRLPMPPRPGEPVRATITGPGRSGSPDLADILSAAYRRTPYARNLPDQGRDAMMGAFLDAVEPLMRTAGAGGMPLADFSLAPGMLANATSLYGERVAPRFGGQLVGGLVSGLTQPADELRQGIAIRSIMRMGKETGETFNLPGLGEVDPKSYTGAMTVMQNAAALPAGQSTRVLRTILEGYRKVVGKGSESSKMFFASLAGGQYGPGAMLERDAEKLLATAPGSEAEASFSENIRKALAKRGAAGTEAAPFIQAARMTELSQTVGEPLALLGQSVRDGVLNFIGYVRQSQAEWDGQVGAMPTPGMSSPAR